LVVIRHGNLRVTEQQSRLSRRYRCCYSEAEERGVTFDMEKSETPVCWMAQFRDPDGNKLVIHKRKQQ